MQGGDKIREELTRLDERGWNTAGQIDMATIMKARGMMSPVLSEVLELYLGEAEECTGERIK